MALNKGIVLVLILFVALCGFSEVKANDDLEQRVEELETKLEDVEERLERQESFADEVHQAFDSVFQNYASSSNAGAETSNNVNLPSSSASTTATATTTRPETTIVYSDHVATVLDVRRVRLSTGYRFTLRYIPHAQNLRVAYVLDHVITNYEVYSYLQELNGEHESGNILSVTFEKSFVPYDEYDHTYVYFTTEKERVGIKVFMNPGTSDVLFTRVDNFPLTVSTEELVYNAGQNTGLLDVEYTNSTDNVNFEIMMVNLSTGNATIKSSLDHSALFDTTISTRYDVGRWKQIQGRIKTSSHRISGYVNIIGSKYTFSNSSAVSNIEIMKKVTLRPANQAGAFPEGYLGFAIADGSKISQDGTQIHVCNITNGNACKGIVTVISQSDVHLTCRKIRPIGFTPLPVTPTSDLEFFEDVQKYLFTVEPPSSSQHPSEVHCTAVNETGFEITKRFAVIHFVQPRILLNKSSVQNGTTNITVVCTATGLPLPTRLFYTGYLGSSDVDYPGYLYHVIEPEDTMISPDRQEVQGSVTFPIDPAQSLNSITCGTTVGYQFTNEAGTLEHVDIAHSFQQIFAA